RGGEIGIVNPEDTIVNVDRSVERIAERAESHCARAVLGNASGAADYSGYTSYLAAICDDDVLVGAIHGYAGWKEQAVRINDVLDGSVIEYDGITLVIPVRYSA